MPPVLPPVLKVPPVLGVPPVARLPPVVAAEPPVPVEGEPPVPSVLDGSLKHEETAKSKSAGPISKVVGSFMDLFLRKFRSGRRARRAASRK
jgi:hypothetical protein